MTEKEGERVRASLSLSLSLSFARTTRRDIISRGLETETTRGTTIVKEPGEREVGKTVQNVTLPGTSDH